MLKRRIFPPLQEIPLLLNRLQRLLPEKQEKEGSYNSCLRELIILNVIVLPPLSRQFMFCVMVFIVFSSLLTDVLNTLRLSSSIAPCQQGTHLGKFSACNDKNKTISKRMIIGRITFSFCIKQEEKKHYLQNHQRIYSPPLEPVRNIFIKQG